MRDLAGWSVGYWQNGLLKAWELASGCVNLAGKSVGWYESVRVKMMSGRRVGWCKCCFMEEWAGGSVVCWEGGWLKCWGMGWWAGGSVG